MLKNITLKVYWNQSTFRPLHLNRVYLNYYGILFTKFNWNSRVDKGQRTAVKLDDTTAMCYV